MQNRRIIFLLILSAVLTGLAQQPLHVGFLAWFSLVPFLFILQSIHKLSKGVWIGFIWGFFYYLSTIFWLAMNIGTTPLIGIISMLAAVLYCTLTSILICITALFLKKYYPDNWSVAFPFIWTFIEFLRNRDILTGGPWTALSNTQTEYLTLIQNAEISGIYGISLWLVFLNVCIFRWLNRPYPQRAFQLIIVFIFPWITGLILTPEIEINKGKSVSVSVIQPNIHLSQKWKRGAAKSNMKLILDASQPAINDSVKLVVWPESATSAFIMQKNTYYLNWIQSHLNNSKLMTGVPYFEGEEPHRKFYNSAVMLSADSVYSLYHKLVLVPMAEHIPLSDIYPSLKELNFGQANFTHGSSYTMYKVDGHAFAPMICFESVLPWLSREFILRGAEVLVYLVNDGWYETAPEPQQHAKQAIFRAVESRRPVIRCTNTGISLVIDPGGNIKGELPLNEAGVINTVIYPKTALTFYTKYGDIFAVMSGIIILLFIAVIPFKKHD
ncbi:MAG: apolipoprotein N-acyltransferase [Candidatus Marinimicrobia bacterium]|nr:apolipoprotein N-acyltransferase [Candidatus Neomarinimicrobiota bacterium]MDP6935996.1 apolipoprotein N-acyltransferase [Candidatus Neomarinimicrobiota bacterium]